MQIPRHHVGSRMNTDGHPRRHHLSVRADRGRNAGRRGHTRAILAKIDTLLAEAGSSKSKLLQVQIWLADIHSYDEMNAVWDAWVDPVNTPAERRARRGWRRGGCWSKSSSSPRAEVLLRPIRSDEHKALKLRLTRLRVSWLWTEAAQRESLGRLLFEENQKPG
jgi:Endoribonuclease L-PSP